MANDRLRIKRGDDSQFTVELTNRDDNPIDLTSCVVFFTAKRRKSDSDEDAAIAVDQTVHIDEEAGLTRFTIPKLVTRELALGDYYWDIRIKYSDGIIQTTETEILTVIPNITDRTEPSS